jgi:hypothetical protein
MYLNGPIRRLGQDETSVLPDLSSPVSISVSPLVLAGAGLLALAFILSGTKKAAGAVVRKGRAVRKALKA